MCTLFVLKETHAPTLRRKLYGEIDSEKKTLTTALRQALSRPLTLLVKSPAVATGCLLIFVVIGILNVFLTELSRTVQRIYNVSSGQSGSMYLGLALGFVAASAIFGSTNDRIMYALARKYNTGNEPEFRLPATIAAMPIVAIGTLWYGWALQYRTLWVVPIVGSGVAGLGVTTVQVISYPLQRFAFNRKQANRMLSSRSPHT